jgi:hypothetical protein
VDSGDNRDLTDLGRGLSLGVERMRVACVAAVPITAGVENHRTATA